MYQPATTVTPKISRVLSKFNAWAISRDWAKMWLRLERSSDNLQHHLQIGSSVSEK